MDATAMEHPRRAGEYFRDLRVLPGAWAVVRVDGRGFTRFAQALFAKPFDARFSEYMVNTAECLLVELGGVYAYTESDEISVLLPPASDLFDRRLERLISVSAGIASAAFTHVAGELAHFDATLWMGVDVDAVADYFCWRQAEAAAGTLDCWCNWALRNGGQSMAQAAEALRALDAGDKRELLGASGIRFEELPAWQRRGVGLRWQRVDGWSFDGGRATMSSVVRRQILIERDLPALEDFRQHLRAVVAEQASAEVPAEHPAEETVDVSPVG